MKIRNMLDQQNEKQYYITKQDEAHEPECRHVCWETKV